MVLVQVRSRRLLALAVSLLASSGVLWTVDSQRPAEGLEAIASEPLGEDVAVGGRLAPFVLAPTPPWRHVVHHLDNHTAQLIPEEGADGIVVLITSPEPLLFGEAVVVGRLAYRAPHPAGDGQTLAVLAVR